MDAQPNPYHVSDTLANHPDIKHRVFAVATSTKQSEELHGERRRIVRVYGGRQSVAQARLRLYVQRQRAERAELMLYVTRQRADRAELMLYFERQRADQAELMLAWAKAEHEVVNQMRDSLAQLTSEIRELRKLVLSCK